MAEGTGRLCTYALHACALYPASSVGDRNFLSTESRPPRCSGAFSGRRAGSHASRRPLNRREPAAGRAYPRMAPLEPRPQALLPLPRAHLAQATAADMRLRKRRRGQSDSAVKKLPNLVCGVCLHVGPKPPAAAQEDYVIPVRWELTLAALTPEQDQSPQCLPFADAPNLCPSSKSFSPGLRLSAFPAVDRKT